MPSVFAGAFSGSARIAVGVWNFVSSSRPWWPGSASCDVDSDVVEPDDTVHPTSLDRRLALQLHTKFDKERNSSLKVVDNDAHVVHPLNRHVPNIGRWWRHPHGGDDCRLRPLAPMYARNNGFDGG
jgi:hypothetical protein